MDGRSSAFWTRWLACRSSCRGLAVWEAVQRCPEVVVPQLGTTPCKRAPFVARLRMFFARPSSNSMQYQHRLQPPCCGSFCSFPCSAPPYEYCYEASSCLFLIHIVFTVLILLLLLLLLLFGQSLIYKPTSRPLGIHLKHP